MEACAAYDWDKALSLMMATGCDGKTAMKHLLQFGKATNAVFVHLQTEEPIA